MAIQTWNLMIEPHFHDVHRNKHQFLKLMDKSKGWVLFLVEKGSFYFEINQHTGVAKAGDIVVCPPNTEFKREVISTLLLHYVSCSFISTNEQAKEPVEKPSPGYLIRFNNCERIRELLQQLREIKSVYMNDRLVWEKHLINQIWYQYCLEQSNQLNNHSLHIDDPLIKKAKNYIDELAFTNFKFKEIAKKLYLSPVQLSRQFKKAYGLTPTDYLIDLRLEKAKLLLIETDYTIYQIAVSCGYDNGFYLSRVFTKKLGIPPSKYRKSHVI